MSTIQNRSSTQRYTLTAALPYANGPIHIGHLAGVYLPGDIYARYLRLKGKEVAFICGSDEGGIAITMRARQEKKSPKQLVDTYHELNKKSLKAWGISFDIFARTSDLQHQTTAQQFFTHLQKKGLLIQKKSEQYYDEEANTFLADRYIQGECPRCAYNAAYGDQCESCGGALSPEELIDPRSMLSGKEPIRRETTHWYLPLDKEEPFLKKWILEAHTDWRKNVYGQCKSWLEGGLKPRAITRDLDWGVPLPNEEGKVLYVWFEAPIGYISATQKWAQEHSKAWEPFWKDKNTRLIHFIGKDNIVFHCILFPAMLKMHGDYILPQTIVANEFLNLQGAKISTSRNHAIWLHEFLKKHPGEEDILRYTLCALAPETKDGDFTWQQYVERNNNELVATLGNFIHRTLTLIYKYYNGKVPIPSKKINIELYRRTLQQIERIEKALDQHLFRQAIGELINLARVGNQYLSHTKPWEKKKNTPEEVATILYQSLQIIAQIAIYSEPFLPFTAKKLQLMIGFNPVNWDAGKKKELIPAGSLIKQPKILFKKIELDIFTQK